MRYVRFMQLKGFMCMACFHPLRAYRLLSTVTETGKRPVVFRLGDVSGRHEVVDLPCGQCMGCRIDKARDWAVRIMHEQSLYDNNCFITLTYNEENLEHDAYKCRNCKQYDKAGQSCGTGSLCRKDFQLFMKRLRRSHEGIEVVDGKRPIRFYHCGEYGEGYGRPHHHAVLFNFTFEDLELWKNDEGVRWYRSQELERLWSYGYAIVGDVTIESASYVARYILKKVNGEKQEEVYKRVDCLTGEIIQVLPEFSTMSRRPGIGRRWFDEYREDVYAKDFFTINGKKFQAPDYYDHVLDGMDPERLEQIKERRRKKVLESGEERTLRRLSTKEKCLRAKVQKKERIIHG